MKIAVYQSLLLPWVKYVSLKANLHGTIIIVYDCHSGVWKLVVMLQFLQFPQCTLYNSHTIPAHQFMTKYEKLKTQTSELFIFDHTRQDVRNTIIQYDR